MFFFFFPPSFSPFGFCAFWFFSFVTRHRRKIEDRRQCSVCFPFPLSHSSLPGSGRVFFSVEANLLPSRAVEKRKDARQKRLVVFLPSFPFFPSACALSTPLLFFSTPRGDGRVIAARKSSIRRSSVGSFSLFLCDHDPQDFLFSLAMPVEKRRGRRSKR